MATDNRDEKDRSGPFEARYLVFLETITNLRPQPAPLPFAHDWVGDGRRGCRPGRSVPGLSEA
jgi:hypothetical protein